MKNTGFRTAKAAGIIWLLFLSTIICSGQWPAYEKYKEHFNQDRPHLLRELAVALEKSPSARNRRLGALSLATAHLREDLFGLCIAGLDSLYQSTPNTDTLLLGVLYRIRSVAEYGVGDPRAALRDANMGIEVMTNSLYLEELLALFVVKAEAMVRLNDLAGAMDQLATAQQLAEHIGSIRGDCMVTLTKGAILYEQQRYTEARVAFLHTLDLASTNGLARIARSALSNLAAVATMTDEYDQSLRFYDSLLVNIGSGNPELRARMHTHKAFVHIEQEEYDKAIRSCMAAIQISDSIDEQDIASDARHDLAYALWRSGKKNDALRIYSDVLARFERSNWTERQRDVHWELFELYAATNEETKALEHLLLYTSLQDSLLTLRFNEELANSEVRFETAEKEQRIAKQSQALKLAETENHRRSIQRNALIASTALLAVITFLLYRTMRTRQRLANKEKELHNEKIDQLLSQQEMKSINAMLEGQEQERARVSKELHDHVGHLLGTIKHQLGQLEEQVADVKSEQTVQYRKVTGLLDNAAGALRRISHDMAAATLNRFGLEKALKDLRDTIHINGRLQVELNTFGLEHPLERGVEIAVYRIIQEAVSNVLKHSQANEMSIAVTHAPGRMSVLVSDNGKGFDTDQASHGVGLANIRSRAAALGAKVQIDSMPGKGTTVSVECPVVE